MAQKSKAYRAAAALLEEGRFYAPTEAVELVKKTGSQKFDSTVEVALKLGVDPRNVIFSSDTSEEQGRQLGKGRGTVDCCYPVKCISGHYGELLFGQRQKLDVLLSPMIYNLPSFLSGHVAKTLTCPRVMAAPENIKAGFIKESDAFAEAGITYVSPFVSLDEPLLVPKQLFEGMREAFPGLTYEETAKAADALDDLGDASHQRKPHRFPGWRARLTLLIRELHPQILGLSQASRFMTDQTRCRSRNCGCRKLPSTTATS